jgi:ribosome biogenesis protein UTP30
MNSFCTSTAKVALESHSAEQMVDNILMAAEAIVKKIPGKWDNVQCIHVKTASSIALPIFNSLPTATIQDEKVQEKESEAPVSLKKKRKTEKKVEEEEKTMADLVQGKEPKKLKTTKRK